MIDTHAHLDACGDPAGELMARARAAGVARVVTVGSGLDSCRAALAICEQEPGVAAALGIHPHQAGEAGLDYYRDYAPRDRQATLFRAQAALAAKLGKALVVHTREADEDTLAVLEIVPAEVPVVLHCFSSPALLEPALERGWYVSFAGNVTYPKAGELRAAAARVPTDRLLVETDSPYLAPQPLRGRPNEPAHVVHVLAALAGARGGDAARLERQIEANAARAFGLA